MPTIVNGHGVRESDETTFVPEGVTLKFYSDFDVDLSSSVNLTALSQVSFDSPRETIEGTGKPDDVANYKLTKEDDELIAAYYATTELQRYVDAALRTAAQAGPPILWVGSDIPTDTRLCATPDVCLQQGSHGCSGVLGRVADTEIVILACRGVAKTDGELTAEQIRAALDQDGTLDDLVTTLGDSPLETRFGSDPNDPLHDLDEDKTALVNSILTLARADPEAAEAEADSYPQGSVAYFQTNKEYATWTVARWAKEYAAQADVEQFVGHLVANASRIQRVRQWFEDIPYYGATVDWLATNHRDLLAEWVRYYRDDGNRDVVTAFTALEEQRAAFSGLLDAPSAPSAEPEATTAVDAEYDALLAEDSDEEQESQPPASVRARVDVVAPDGQVLFTDVEGVIHQAVAGMRGWLALADPMLDLPAGDGYVVHSTGTLDTLIAAASADGILTNLEFDDEDLNLV